MANCYYLDSNLCHFCEKWVTQPLSQRLFDVNLLLIISCRGTRNRYIYSFVITPFSIFVVLVFLYTHILCFTFHCCCMVQMFNCIPRSVIWRVYMLSYDNTIALTQLSSIEIYMGVFARFIINEGQGIKQGS